MPLIQEQETQAYRLGIWKITESAQELEAMTGITDAPGKRGSARRSEFLAVRALARHMGLDCADIAYKPTGKPYLKGYPYAISISHTKGYAVLLLSPHALSGIDIEYRSNRVNEVRHKFMHSQEEAWITGLHPSPEAETDLLLVHWCAKEALYKAIAQPGIHFCDELRVAPFEAYEAHTDTQEAGQLRPSGSLQGRDIRGGRTFQMDYWLNADFVLICCFEAESTQ
jgi:phosphopantetheinyl transferase